MKTVTVTIGVALLGVLGGCATDHKMRDGSAAKVTVCRECYDEAVRVWDSGRYAGERWIYAPSTRIYVEHQCASCKSTMVVLTEDGRWTIRCPTCAPDGVPCDKCLPGDVAAPSPSGK